MNKKNENNSQIKYLTAEMVDEIISGLLNGDTIPYNRFNILYAMYSDDFDDDLFFENLIILMHKLIDINAIYELMELIKIDPHIAILNTDDKLSVLVYSVEQGKPDTAIAILDVLCKAVVPEYINKWDGNYNIGYMAVLNNQIEIVRYLLNIGSPSKYFCGQYTALQLATKMKNAKMVYELIEIYNHDPNEIGYECTPCITFAVMNNDIVLAEYLVERGADVNAIDKNGMRAVDYSTDNKITKLLKAHGGVESDENSRLICKAVKCITEEHNIKAAEIITDKLLDNGEKDFVAGNNDLLLESLFYNYISIAQKILNSNIYFDKHSESLVDACVLNSDCEIKPIDDILPLLNLLAQCNYKVKENDNFLAMNIVARSSLELEKTEQWKVIKLLELMDECGCSVVTDDYRFFIMALNFLNVHVIHYCLIKNMKVTELDKKSDGAISELFHWTNYKYKKQHVNELENTLKLLLENGADIHHKNSFGRTVLDIITDDAAVYDDNTDLLFELLKKYGFFCSQ